MVETWWTVIMQMILFWFQYHPSLHGRILELYFLQVNTSNHVHVRENKYNLNIIQMRSKFSEYIEIEYIHLKSKLLKLQEFL